MPTVNRLPNINTIIREISHIAPPSMPTIDNFIVGNDFFTELGESLKVIRKYKSREHIWDLQSLLEDSIYLSAVHASMSETVGYLQGMSSRAENVKKVTRAQYSLKIKEEREKIFNEEKIHVKLTEKEIDDATRVLASEEAHVARDTETVSRMISAGWYAIADFIKVLNTAVYRLGKEREISDRTP